MAGTDLRRLELGSVVPCCKIFLSSEHKHRCLGNPLPSSWERLHSRPDTQSGYAET
jgi:hypothetical protein